MRGGVIRAGSFNAMTTPAIQSPEGWVAACLERPSCRATLLDGDANQLTMGAVGSPAHGVSALVTTYAMFDRRDPARDAQTILKVLKRQRAGRGVTWLKDKTVQEQADRIAAKRIHPEVALESALSRMSSWHNRPVNGLYIVTNDLGSIEFPAELLNAARLSVAIGVTHVKLPGSPWGVYIVLVTMVRGAVNQAAHRSVQRG